MMCCGSGLFWDGVFLRDTIKLVPVIYHWVLYISANSRKSLWNLSHFKLPRSERATIYGTRYFSSGRKYVKCKRLLTARAFLPELNLVNVVVVVLFKERERWKNRKKLHSIFTGVWYMNINREPCQRVSGI